MSLPFRRHIAGNPPGRRLGMILITITAVLWGSGGVVVQLLHDRTGLGPEAIAFYRLAVAAPPLGALAIRHGGAFRGRPRWALLIATGIGLAAYQALFYVAVTAVGVAVATMLSIGLGPLGITLWETVWRRALPTRSTVATLAVATLGLVVVTLGGLHDGTGPRPWLGLACATGSGLGYAVTTALSGRLAATVKPAALAAITTTVGAVVLAPVAVAVGLTFAVTTGSVLGLAYLGPVTTAVAYALFYRGLVTTDAGTASMITLLEPLAAAILAAVVLGQPLPLTTLLGGALMLGAITVLYRRGSSHALPSRRRRRPSSGDRPDRRPARYAPDHRRDP